MTAKAKSSQRKAPTPARAARRERRATARAVARYKHSRFPWHRYAEDVVAGKVPAGELVIKACDRHLHDLALAATRKNFAYWFDDEEAELCIAFIGLLRQSKGEWAGLPLTLEPWQQFIIGSIFGWKRTSDGTRRFRTAYIEIPRKNGKSTLCSAIGLIMLVMDGEAGAEIYSGATKKDQAKIVWEEAKRMVQKSPALRKRVQCNKQGIFVESTASRFIPLATEEDTLDGLNVHCGIVDELHRHKSPIVWTILETGTSARRQPLMVGITTAGAGETGICWDLHDQCVKILEGILKIETVFTYIACANKADADRPNDPEVWRRANPNLGVSKKYEYLREQAAKATSPSLLADFKRLDLNIWSETNDPCVDMNAWKTKCSGAIALEIGRRCFGGLDLAQTRDIASFCAVFPPAREGEPWKAKWLRWCPKERIAERSKHDRVDYERWVKLGLLRATEGDLIDYKVIRQDIKEFADKYLLAEIGFDPYNATEIATNLAEEDGFVMVQVKQSYLNLSEPFTKTLDLITKGQIRHGDDEVATWMAANVTKKQDGNGLIRPAKPTTGRGSIDWKRKTDDFVALVMGMGRANAHTEETSAYDDPSVVTAF